VAIGVGLQGRVLMVGWRGALCGVVGWLSEVIESWFRERRERMREGEKEKEAMFGEDRAALEAKSLRRVTVSGSS
jgi:hypothetical protein